MLWKHILGKVLETSLMQNTEEKLQISENKILLCYPLHQDTEIWPRERRKRINSSCAFPNQLCLIWDISEKVIKQINLFQLRAISISLYKKKKLNTNKTLYIIRKKNNLI